MSTTNAIMRRVESLTELWEGFAQDPSARLACWRLDHDSRRMFELFLDLQSEEASDLPDLFVRCGEPFASSRQHGETVRESLVRQYEEVREALVAEGIAATWRCPPSRRNQDGLDALVAACASLRQTHESIVRHVVVVLLPHSVSSPEAWREWLQQLLSRQIPEHVRFLAADSATDPQLEGLCRGEPERVMVLQPELAMNTAYLELLREVPGSGPGFLFRRFFVALGDAAGKGNLEVARRLAEHASRIAARQQWSYLDAAVALTLGAACMSQQDHAAALECYRKGLGAVAGATDDVGRKVAQQARFAEASALIAASRPAEAAKVYEQIREASQPLGDSFARLEGARMAAYCHELAGNRDAAWASALDALATGESLPAEAARQSTLPFLGDALLRLAPGRPPAERNAIQKRLDNLLGSQWNEAAGRGAQT